MSYHRIKKELKETFNLNLDIAFKYFLKQDIYKLLGKSQTEPQINTSIQSLVEKYHPENIWLVYVGMFDLSNFELTSNEKNIIENYHSIKNFMCHCPKSD